MALVDEECDWFVATHFKMTDLLKKFDKNFNAAHLRQGGTGPRCDEAAAGSLECCARACGWVGGWTPTSGAPSNAFISYATQEGEISFSDYNTSSRMAEHHREEVRVTARLQVGIHGRHEIFSHRKGGCKSTLSIRRL